MVTKTGARTWVGEFLLVALGVLAALAVDRWGEARNKVEVEDHLLEVLAANLTADSLDLDLAMAMVARRLWLVEELDFGISGDLTTGFPRALPDSLLQFRRGVWDPVAEPLNAFNSWPDFDLSDDAYREMMATGSFAVIRDSSLRSAVLRYYRIAEDQGENERRVGQYQEQFESALASVDVAITDGLTLGELRDRFASPPHMSVELRRASSRMQLQLRYYRNIERARAELLAVLNDALRGR